MSWRARCSLVCFFQAATPKHASRAKADPWQGQDPDSLDPRFPTTFLPRLGQPVRRFGDPARLRFMGCGKDCMAPCGPDGARGGGYVPGCCLCLSLLDLSLRQTIPHASPAAYARSGQKTRHARYATEGRAEGWWTPALTLHIPSTPFEDGTSEARLALRHIVPVHSILN